MNPSTETRRDVTNLRWSDDDYQYERTMYSPHLDGELIGARPISSEVPTILDLPPGRNERHAALHMYQGTRYQPRTYNTCIHINSISRSNRMP